MDSRATGTASPLPLRPAPVADWRTPQGLAAVRAAEDGYRVFPLVAGAKVPPKGSTHTHTATDDPDAVIRQWSETPDANVGILADGLVVIDTDTPEAEALVAELDLPPCPTVQTRRGRHRYFRGPGRSGPTAVRGLDVKAGPKAYVLGAGSIVKGHTYEYVEGLAPWEVGKTPPLPPDLGRLIAKRPARDRAADTTGEPIPKGQRNSSLTSYAGRLRYAGVPPESIARELADRNTSRCNPPLPTAEVEAIARNAKKWDAPPPWAHSGPARRTFLRDSRLSPRDRLVLDVLTTYANPEGVADPGPTIDTLARDTGMNRDTVSTALRDLADVGRIEWVKRPRKASRYCLLPYGKPAADAA